MNALIMLLMLLGGLLPRYEYTASACPNLYQHIEWFAFAGISSSLTAFALSGFFNIMLFNVCMRTLGQGQTGIASFLASAVSQFIDTSVIYIMLFFTHSMPIQPDQNILIQLAIYIFTGYTYKFLWSIGGSGLIHAMSKKPA